MFVLGQLTCSGVVVIGLCAMEVVSGDLVGSAHGLACAVAQGEQLSTTLAILGRGY